MALPSLSYTIDDEPVELIGFSGTSVAFGGFAQARGTIKEARARQIPSTVGQGSKLEVFAGGSSVWEGRLSAPPAIRGGLASFAAQGESVRAAKRATRLMYQTRNYGVLTDIQNPPHNVTSTSPNKLHMQINDGGILIGQEPGETINVGEYVACALWTPGQPINRVAYEWLSTFADASWKIEVLSSEGPSAGGLTSRSSTGMGATSQTVDTSWSPPANHDMVQIQQVWRGGSPAGMGAHYTLIKNLRINGQSSADFFADDVGYASEVLTDVGRRLGYDISGVTTSGFNVLPLDWTSGSWAELLSYVASLEDRYWGVYEDSKLLYPAWGDREWTVYQADGATVDLTPLELYNQVTVKYVDVGGAPREVTVTASPDPLAASGIVNVWEESIADVQPGSTLATAVANNLLSRVSSQRYAGRIDCIKAIDSTGRDAPYEIRAGDTVRVADWDMNTAVTLRVFEVEYTPNGVSLGIESGVSIASLLGRAGLAGARAPSTAQLPELLPPEPAPIPTTLDERLAAAGIRPGQHMHHGRLHRHAPFGGHLHHGQHHVHG